MKNKKTIIIAILAAIALIFIFKDELLFLYKKAQMFYNPQMIRNLIMSFGYYSVIVFLILQIMQVILFFIPGEVTQISGGYAFGVLMGSILSLVGIIIGSCITFFISRLYGDRLLKKILPLKKYKKIKSTIDRKNNKKIIFLLYLIPGVPKDIVGYVCGITNINLKSFVIISTIARIPGILISAYFGSNLYNSNYIVIVIIGILSAIIVWLGVKKGDKIIKYLEK